MKLIVEVVMENDKAEEAVFALVRIADAIAREGLPKNRQMDSLEDQYTIRWGIDDGRKQ